MLRSRAAFAPPHSNRLEAFLWPIKPTFSIPPRKQNPRQFDRQPLCAPAHPCSPRLTYSFALAPGWLAHAGAGDDAAGRNAAELQQ